MEFKNLLPILITLVVAGLMLGIGAIVMQNLEDTQLTSSTATAENITLITSTAVELANYRVTGVSLVNVTGNVTLAAANYTVGTGTEISKGTVTLAVGGTVHNNSWALVTYTYDSPNDAGSSIDSAQSGITALFSDWLPIIIIVLVSSMILFIIIGAVGIGKR